jgi:hypothetical protein
MISYAPFGFTGTAKTLAEDALFPPVDFQGGGDFVFRNLGPEVIYLVNFDLDNGGSVDVNEAFPVFPGEVLRLPDGVYR